METCCENKECACYTCAENEHNGCEGDCGHCVGCNGKKEDCVYFKLHPCYAYIPIENEECMEKGGNDDIIN